MRKFEFYLPLGGYNCGTSVKGRVSFEANDMQDAEERLERFIKAAAAVGIITYDARSIRELSPEESLKPFLSVS